MSTNGLVVDGEGWFVVDARESRWRDEGRLGRYCTFEGFRRATRTSRLPACARKYAGARLSPRT